MSHPHDILILAVTRMRSGVCVAGMTGEADSISRLRWVRPVKRHGLLLYLNTREHCRGMRQRWSERTGALSPNLIGFN